MCEPTAMLIAGVAIQAGSSIMAGNAQAAAAKKEAQMVEEQAKQERLRFRQAENDRRQEALELAASNRAAAAASGAAAGSESFLAVARGNERIVNRDIGRVRTQSAFTQGNLAAQAGNLRAEAKAARRSGLMGAAASIAGGGYTYYKNR